MNKISSKNLDITNIFKDFEKLIEEEKQFFQEETFTKIKTEMESLFTLNKNIELNSTNIYQNFQAKNSLISNVKQFSKELDEKFKYEDMLGKCKQYFKEKNLNEYRETEKNDKIRILNFNEEEDFFYFGETLSADAPDIMDGFGFISNSKENEFFLGNFKEDNFINGFWFKSKTEVFFGEFNYKDTTNTNQKTHFKGLMNNNAGTGKVQKRVSEITHKNFSHFLFGEVDFINIDFTGLSLKINNSSPENNEIRLDSGTFKNNKKNCKNMLSLVILGNLNEKNTIRRSVCDKNNKEKPSTFKLIFGNYEDDKLIDDYFLMDDFSIIRINADNTNFFSEVIEDGEVFYRGEFKNESKTEIKPIIQGQGTLIDAKNNIRYKGNFENGKREGPNETLILLIEKPNSISNDKDNANNIDKGKGNENQSENPNFILQKFEGEFKSGNLLKGNITSNDQKVIENGEFNQNFDIIKGTIYHENSEMYIGDFTNNKREGCGTYRYQDKKEYHGIWKQGNRHGIGTLFMEDRNKFITGEWEENRLRKINDTNMELSDVKINESNLNQNNNVNDNAIMNNKIVDLKQISPKKENIQDVNLVEKKEENLVPEKKEENVKVEIKEENVNVDKKEENINAEKKEENVKVEIKEENLSSEKKEENVNVDKKEENVNAEKKDENVKVEIKEENVKDEKKDENLAPEKIEENSVPEKAYENLASEMNEEEKINDINENIKNDNSQGTIISKKNKKKKERKNSRKNY